MRDLIAKYLNATFPGKDFSQRFMFTDNAWDHTFWPFWIAAEPEEDIVWETARAVSILRRIYKERADDRRALYELTDPDCPISEEWKNKLMGIGEVPCANKEWVDCLSGYSSVRDEYVNTIRFTNQSYRSIIKKLGNDYNRRYFEQLLECLINSESHGLEILKQSTLLEKGFEIVKKHKLDLYVIMQLFFEDLDNKDDLEYKSAWDFFGDLPSILLPSDGRVLTQKNMYNGAREIVSVNKDKKPLKPDKEKMLRNMKMLMRMAKAEAQGLLK